MLVAFEGSAVSRGGCEVRGVGEVVLGSLSGRWPIRET